VTKLVTHDVDKSMSTCIYKSEIWYQGLHLSDYLRLSAGIERFQHDVEYRFFFGFLLPFI
jgi:hypothetical protein